MKYYIDAHEISVDDSPAIQILNNSSTLYVIYLTVNTTFSASVMAHLIPGQQTTIKLEETGVERLTWTGYVADCTASTGFSRVKLTDATLLYEDLS